MNAQNYFNVTEIKLIENLEKSNSSDSEGHICVLNQKSIFDKIAQRGAKKDL